MSETSDLTGPLIDALNQTGGLAIRMNSGVIRMRGRTIQLHKKGTADILFFPRCCHADLTRTPVWIETKTGKSNKEQVENQSAFKAQVEALGHRYIRVTSIQEGLDAI